MSETDKPLVWVQGEVKTPPFSTEARLKAGFLLRRLQKGDLIRITRFQTDALYRQKLP
jgi:hypothetical protein